MEGNLECDHTIQKCFSKLQLGISFNSCTKQIKKNLVSRESLWMVNIQRSNH